MLTRILCPRHQEKTPSCIVYSNGYKCYSCGAWGPLSDLTGVPLPPIEPEQEPEDLEATFAYIDSLPKQEIRGLMLPVDGKGYYIVWPGRKYYKYRFFEPGKAKYIGARGHQKPMFLGGYGIGDTCVVIEGEINALSLAQAFPGLTILSPGGSGDFSQKRTIQYYRMYYRFYDKIVILVDQDAAGARAAMDLMGYLKARGHQVHWKLMKPDANDLLCGGGSAKLQEEIRSVLESAMEGRP